MQATLHPVLALLQPLAGLWNRPSPSRPALARQRHLDRFETLRLARSDRVLHVVQGCVWITRDGCPEDVVLEAGGRFVHEQGACVLVHALDEAQLVLAG